MFIAGLIALSFLAVASSHPVKTKDVTFNKLPVASCDKSRGVLCVPDACKKASCSVVKDAICIADRCGCEARWFQFDEKKSMYKDVTATCGSFKAITDFAKFLDTQQDEDAAVSISPNEILTIFRKFNSLTSEALEYIASYMKKYVKENPTRESLQRYEAATALLKTLDRSKKALDAAVTERSFFTKAIGLAKKYGPTALKVGKAVYGALKSDEQNPDDVFLMDEDTDDMTQNIEWRTSGWSKEVSRDEMADEDENSLGVLGPRPKPRPKVCLSRPWLNICSNPNATPDPPTFLGDYNDIQIAAEVLSDDGPFSDALNDPEARVNWLKIGQVAGKIGKKVAGLLL